MNVPSTKKGPLLRKGARMVAAILQDATKLCCKATDEFTDGESANKRNGVPVKRRRGSRDTHEAPAVRLEADGGRFAMGNTEEALIVANLGVPERGAKADGPWRRAMGTGWVRGTVDHDYADAQRRGHPVTLLVTETTGALSPTFNRALRALGKHARAPTTHDSTRYGLSRSSPGTFLAHHRAAISAAVVLATTISLAAPAMSFKLTMGMSPF